MGRAPLSQGMPGRWDGMEAGPTWKKLGALLGAGSFAINCAVVCVLLSLGEGGRTQGAASLYLFPCNKKDSVGRQLPPVSPKRNQARSVEAHLQSCRSAWDLLSPEWNAQWGVEGEHVWF